MENLAIVFEYIIPYYFFRIAVRKQTHAFQGVSRHKQDLLLQTLVLAFATISNGSFRASIS